MKTRLLTRLLALGAAGLLAPAALADDGPDLSWSTIDAGGVFTSSYTSLSMSATLGQPDVGAMYGGDLSMTGGFWVVVPDSGGCLADWDGNGLIEPSDVASFVNAWFFDLVNGTAIADLDGSGQLEPSDVAMFINAWASALSGGGC